MIDPATLPQLAHARQDDFEVMRYQLIANDDILDDEFDAIIAAIATPIIAQTDCTLCGNCCHKLDVYLTPDDANRLSVGIHIPLTTLLTDTIRDARAVGEWGRFAHSPCRFLSDKKCTVYEHRPQTCRDYPVFTPDFRWMLDDMIDGATICPIIYETLCAVWDYVEHDLYGK
ncbi:MAG: YkgJ family cysteine cluster protein [Phototrophicales bacterium]|nr:YkgJ family cysteine cluster protein [Phototrophicales bacterium]